MHADGKSTLASVSKWNSGKVNLPQHSLHITLVQYIGGCSVHWRLFSTLEAVQYIEGIVSVLWGIASVLWRLLSTVGNNISTVEITSVLWRVFSTVD